MSVSRLLAPAKLALCLIALSSCATSNSGVPVTNTDAEEAIRGFKRDEIFGKTAATLDNLLGAPALVRREGDGEFRRYSLAKCGLIVILYPEGGREPKVTHLDATARNSSEPKPDVDSCLASGIA